ncbi:MAG TPA: hypothetical protein VMV13_02640 [Candidatus Binataceae bacterium]|nr:hypothetical protein [Candidatus Binataceae bacterium]
MRKLVPIFFILAVPLMQGCFAAAAPLASPAVEGISSLTGTAGSTTTGYFTSQSQIDLNKANIAQLKAQAELTRAQAAALRDRQCQLDGERATTVGILRDTADARNDPTLDNLAMWVAAGGDPDYAMKYMLTQKAPAPKTADRSND